MAGMAGAVFLWLLWEVLLLLLVPQYAYVSVTLFSCVIVWEGPKVGVR